MRILILTSALVPLLWAGCKQLDCDDGTIERNGSCVPADESTGDAKCGPFTMLVGDQCVPTLTPTVCGSGTVRDVDPSGVTKCIGVGGGGGCGAQLACPPPAAGKQTICGQLFDLETGTPFAAPDATGMPCAAGPTATGPCSVRVQAFDAVAFAMNPAGAMALTVGEPYLDDCGRYRLGDITLPGSPFIGLGIDDADPTKRGPAGTTNTVGVATQKFANLALKDFEAFVAPKATTDKWTASGGPPLSGGIYAMMFRANKTGQINNSGVTVTRGGNPINPNDDSYFPCGTSVRTDIMAGGTSTGANGTALVINASLADGLTAYSGTSPSLPAQCQYSAHPGVALPFILFMQIVRPLDKAGMTCPL